MQTSVCPLPIRLAPLLPEVLRQWAEPLEPALFRLLVPPDLAHCFEQARRAGTSTGFAQRLLDVLDIRFELDELHRKRIPAAGSAILVANHPFGIVEGLILATLLDGIRPDWKILVNSLLGGVTELCSHMVLVNPFEARDSNRQNRRPLRESIRFLSEGGALAIFPAGEVAHFHWPQPSIIDPPWKSTAARLALRSHAPVVPVFFEGANSLQFQVAGVFHPGLRTIGLAREFHKLRGKVVRLRIGQPIPQKVLAAYGDPERATAYMRSRTLFLSNRSQAAPLHLSRAGRKRACTIDPPDSGQLLSEEVAALPAEAELASNHDFAVFIADAASIPRLLRDIGRSREIAFRAIGEGTGNQTDLDRFDEHYQHLFLWSRNDRCIAGAYRLAVTSDVLPRLGQSGLYTSTLFRFQPQFFEAMGPAVELGRSFVLPQYQKNYASLLSLWKGIMRFVQRRPEAPVLFGAVGISQTYRKASRGLIAAYLAQRTPHELARFVRPRTRFRDRSCWDQQTRTFTSLATGIEDLSLPISDIEDDGKGVPVLIRQYLKMGGRLLGFNLDPSFSNALDALMLADLRTVSPAFLERCLGRTGAQAFTKISESATTSD